MKGEDGVEESRPDVYRGAYISRERKRGSGDPLSLSFSLSLSSPRARSRSLFLFPCPSLPLSLSLPLRPVSPSLFIPTHFFPAVTAL